MSSTLFRNGKTLFLHNGRYFRVTRTATGHQTHATIGSVTADGRYNHDRTLCNRKVVATVVCNAQQSLNYAVSCRRCKNAIQL